MHYTCLLTSPALILEPEAAILPLLDGTGILVTETQYGESWWAAGVTSDNNSESLCRWMHFLSPNQRMRWSEMLIRCSQHQYSFGSFVPTDVHWRWSVEITLYQWKSRTFQMQRQLKVGLNRFLNWVKLLNFWPTDCTSVSTFTYHGDGWQWTWRGAAFQSLPII